MRSDHDNAALYRSACVLAMMGLLFASTVVHAANSSSLVTHDGRVEIAVNGVLLTNSHGVFVYSGGVSIDSYTFQEGMKRIIRETSDRGIPVLSFHLFWLDADASEEVPESPEAAVDRLHLERIKPILDEAEARNVRVFLPIFTHCHATLPKWWPHYRDNARRVQQIGPDTPNNAAYNRLQWPVASYGNEDHRELLGAVIRRMTGLYKDHPALAGWVIAVGPTGENGYTPNYINLMFDRRMPAIDFPFVMADYSSFAAERFRVWLKTKYASAEALANAWGQSGLTFDRVEPPQPLRLTAAQVVRSSGDRRRSMLDWQQFRLEEISGEWRFLSRALRAADPEKLIMGRTCWTPMIIPSGTQDMMGCGVGVCEEKLIDVDLIDAGIASGDFMPRFSHISSSSLIDYANLGRFSRSLGLARVCNLENWIGYDGFTATKQKIEQERSGRINSVLAEEGSYFWFCIGLPGDRTFNKPVWTWEEVDAALAAPKSTRGAGEPQAAFLYDLEQRLPHYNGEPLEFTDSRLLINLARAFYYAEVPVNYTFINVKSFSTNAPHVHPGLLIGANMRHIQPTALNAMNAHVAAGGALLLLGANGLFDPDGRPDPSGLHRLAPQLTAEEVQRIQSWGTSTTDSVPLLLVTATRQEATYIPVQGQPARSYATLANLLDGVVSLHPGGTLDFGASVPWSDRRGREHKPGPPPPPRMTPSAQ